MELDVKPYRQRKMTCAISCMLMVLEYYKVIPKADWLYEKNTIGRIIHNIWREHRFLH